MIYAEILAGGKGTRMGNVNIPKQFLTINDKPIIIHTIEKFILTSDFEKILIIIPGEWINYTHDIIKKYIGYNERLHVITGGDDRNESIMNGIRFIEDRFGISDTDYIVTHDSVRPFLTHRIIKENIEQVKKYNAVDTAIKAVDTIIESEDGEVISNIPNRSILYQGQTPQSFHIKTLLKHYNKLTTEQKSILTDACKICSLSGEDIKIVRGEVFNIKITTPYDLKVANSFIKESKSYD